MATVIFEITYKEWLLSAGLKADNRIVMDCLKEIKKQCLRETKQEFDMYRRRAGIEDKSFIRTIHMKDDKGILRILSTEDIPSSSNKKLLIVNKNGNPEHKTVPITTANKWISDGILRNSFVERLARKYRAKIAGKILDVMARGIL